MNEFETINEPTLILNPDIAKMNIAKMAEKAKFQGIRFRPHFKTHQAAQIGQWYCEVGVDAITVSSVKMAQYFAKQGWKDILIAFPVNTREINEIRELSEEIHLGLLVDNFETLDILENSEKISADIWVKIDTGMRRAGIHWQDNEKQDRIIEKIIKNPELKLGGLLTHAGQTYHAQSPGQIKSLYHESVDRINECKRELESTFSITLQVSVGDTPGCWLVDDLGDVDEIRPGNFIFFDAMMHNLGVCKIEDISVCVACPVVSKYDERHEVLIWGGAVHFSKEVIEYSDPPNYGYVMNNACGRGWDFRASNFVRALSQEHGVVTLDEETFKKISIGDLLFIIPVHSCLAVECLREYFTCEGNWIPTGVG